LIGQPERWSNFMTPFAEKLVRFHSVSILQPVVK
jgi:hypothetical protein